MTYESKSKSVHFINFIIQFPVLENSFKFKALFSVFNTSLSSVYYHRQTTTRQWQWPGWAGTRKDKHLLKPCNLDLRPLNLWMNAFRATAIINTCTKFGVDSSSRFPVRLRTNRQTDKQTNRQTKATELPTHADSNANVGNNESAHHVYH